MLNLKVENISLSYGTTEVLKNISMEFKKPGVVGIIGPNGAGKSTLLKCINNILRPQRGKVLIDGNDTSGMDAVGIARKIGYVPQEFPVSFLSTVFDTVLTGRRPYTSWGAGKKDMKIAAGVIKMLSLEDIALRNMSELSGGQQQRVMIARALAQQSGIMLLDEPTSKLDIRHQLEVMNIIKTLSSEKQILSIIVMHDLNLASRYTDRIIMLKSGSIASSGNPVNVLTKENIREVYGVDAKIVIGDGLLHIMPIRPV
ncbi:iron complex transport system ATP-binding protein [Methanomicrobium sp. W14]|uniref:ABC transporter ATP-binding protein n=1 Tax=Methanomicrobium sp. W14 TaxID=2817839 RepID=UPI001AE1B40B|nr:ABC transporter ATP-binding protein [Methanomicrobium sp. W14]MBP2133072.1 iron complex transport system ATP-binding protein [Methanomicrobium sp. W14]